ncbi:MAG: hemerythrin family protein [Treponema sp.]|nr:hemerythrin family protein [Treponema sp.]
MIKKSNLIEWEKRYMLGVPLIDGQHKELVRLTNDLHFACRDSRETANDCFIRVAREAVNYVRYHFSTEEKMMLLLMFPHFNEHKKHHESFVKEILHQTKMFSEQQNLVPNRFVHFLKDWVLSHIAVRDKVFAEYVLSLRDADKLEMMFDPAV